MKTPVRSRTLALLALISASGANAAPSPGWRVHPCESVEASIRPGEAVVRYYSHSGVSVRTPAYELVFDYVGPHAKDGPRTTGVLDPADLGARTVVVFVTHAHHDHFDPVVLSWADRVDLWVVSPDVAADSRFAREAATWPGSRVIVLAPYEEVRLAPASLPEIHVRTTRSTDAGVAFLLSADGVSLYHSGDLALWGWDAGTYDARGEEFRMELDRFVRAHRPLDFAFVCSDLRPKGRGYLTGAGEVLAAFEPGVAFAIHNWDRHAAAAAALVKRAHVAGLSTVVAPIEEFGQCFRLERLAKPRVQIRTPLGDIVIELYPSLAPVTVANFLRYVDEERFDPGSFYRTVTLDNQPHDDVRIEVIQGGIGPGGSDRRLDPIAHETTEATGVRHVDGAISMARLAPGSASSEFFFCIGDQPELDFGGRRNPDGQGFAAFGRLVEGPEVMRSIHARAARDQMLVKPVEIVEVNRVR